MNVIGTMLGLVLLTVGLFEGRSNHDVFYACLTQTLVPIFPINTAVVMDNTSFHQPTDRVKVVKQPGALLAFLPLYSPYLNPLEKQWAQAKAIRKRERAMLVPYFRRM